MQLVAYTPGMKSSTIVLYLYTSLSSIYEVVSIDVSETYRLSPDEIRMLWQQQQQNKRKPMAAKGHFVADPDNNLYIDGITLCDQYSITIVKTGWRYKFRFADAQCTPDTGDLRKFRVVCDVTLSKPPSMQEEPPSLTAFARWCPKNYVCQDWKYKTIDFVEKQDVHCVSQDQINLDKLDVAEAIPGSHGELYCSPQQQVPESQYALDSSKGINLIASEAAVWPNGTAYIAPILECACCYDRIALEIYRTKSDTTDETPVLHGAYSRTS